MNLTKKSQFTEIQSPKKIQLSGRNLYQQQSMNTTRADSNLKLNAIAKTANLISASQHTTPKNIKVNYYEVETLSTPKNRLDNQNTVVGGKENLGKNLELKKLTTTIDSAYNNNDNQNYNKFNHAVAEKTDLSADTITSNVRVQLKNKRNDGRNLEQKQRQEQKPKTSLFNSQSFSISSNYQNQNFNSIQKSENSINSLNSRHVDPNQNYIKQADIKNTKVNVAENTENKQNKIEEPITCISGTKIQKIKNSKNTTPKFYHQNTLSNHQNHQIESHLSNIHAHSVEKKYQLKELKASKSTDTIPINFSMKLKKKIKNYQQQNLLAQYKQQPHRSESCGRPFQKPKNFPNL